MTSPAPTNKALPPTMPVAIKRENNNGSSNVRAGITRRDSLGWGADDLLGMISHTPPAFSPGSLTMPMTKRGRSGSISSRLLSATDLEERGIIDRQQKGVLKDLIISGDEALQKALEKFDAGDASSLEALLDSGALNRKSSVDLLDDLDLGFLNVGSLGDTPKDEVRWTCFDLAFGQGSRTYGALSSVALLDVCPQRVDGRMGRAPFRVGVPRLAGSVGY
jgi:hypothetical protein